MIREILNGDFMDYRQVQEKCCKYGLSKSEVRSLKRKEGIRTVEIMNEEGQITWLWFDPQQIWEKYHA